MRQLSLEHFQKTLSVENVSLDAPELKQKEESSTPSAPSEASAASAVLSASLSAVSLVNSSVKSVVEEVEGAERTTAGATASAGGAEERTRGRSNFSGHETLKKVSADYTLPPSLKVRREKKEKRRRS